MNSVERVKAICKERKIAISRLEKACGFGNGYISQLKKGVFPDDRLYKVAAYLKVEPEYLLFGESSSEKKNNPVTEFIDNEVTLVKDASDRKEVANAIFASLSEEDQMLALIFLKKLSQTQLGQGDS